MNSILAPHHNQQLHPSWTGLVSSVVLWTITTTSVVGYQTWQTRWSSRQQVSTITTTKDLPVQGETTESESTNPSTNQDWNRIVELLPIENWSYHFDPPITTLTWFCGDHTKAAQILRHRVQQILYQNPWLGGSVVLRQKKVYLVFSHYDTDVDGSVTSPMLQVDHHIRHVSTPNDSPIAMKAGTTTIQDLSNATRAYRLSKQEARTCLWRVTILPCRNEPTKYFALIMSMCHAIGDGHTFYAIHRMLCSSGEESIPALLVDRIQTSQDQQIQLLGKEEFELKDSWTITWSVLGGFLWKSMTAFLLGPCMESYCFQVDQHKMQQLKEQAAKEGNVPFVSTNDIIMSWFFHASRCHHAIMTINFRNRIEGHSNMHAGNYYNHIFYQRDDIASASLIRKSIQTYKRAITGTTMPSLFRRMVGTKAMGTNWCTFAAPNDLDGCEEIFQIPLLDTIEALPYHIVHLCIFRATSNMTCFQISGNSTILRACRDPPFGTRMTTII